MAAKGFSAFNACLAIVKIAACNKKFPPQIKYKNRDHQTEINVDLMSIRCLIDLLWSLGGKSALDYQIPVPGERQWSRRAAVEQESSGGAGERRWSSSGAGERRWSRRTVVEVSGGGEELRGRGEEECIMQFRSIILIRVVRENFWMWKVREFCDECPRYFFSCDQAALRTLIFRLSVCHTFLTMFRSSHHPEIFMSYYHWWRWCPCKRSKVKVTEVMTPFNHFQTITQVWIHIWRWNDAWSLMLLRRGALLFFKVIRQTSRSHGKKKLSILTQFGRFRIVTPVWIYQWLWNDAQSLM